MGTIDYTSFTDVSALTRAQKEELLRRLRVTSPATPPPIVARARKVAVIPDVDGLSEAQVDERLRQLLSGLDSPRYEQLRNELPQSGAETKRLLLRRILELTFRNASMARLSYAQQRSWFLQSLDPGSPAQNIAAAVRAQGPLDVRLLERCINAVIQRHDALRTNFIVMGSEPAQLIFRTRNVQIVEHTFDHIPEAERMETVMRSALDEAYRPFDLGAGSLIRLTSFRVLPQDRILLLNMHHIIGDEWSIGELIGELGTLYAEGANPNSLEPLEIQHADYAEWEEEVLTPEAMKHHLSYWKQKLAGAEFTLEVPTDRPRPEVQTTNGAMESMLLSPVVRNGVASIARGEQATLFMTMLAAFNVLLCAWTGREDILVGTDFASRSRREIAKLIGFFVNELVFRTDLSDNPTFRELVRRVRHTAHEAYQHQDLPFQWLVEQLRPPRDRSRSPIFQVVFDLHNIPLELHFQGITFSPIRLPLRPAKYDLTLFISETPRDMWALLEYNTDLYNPDTARRLLEDYHAVLSAVSADPDARVSDLILATRKPAGNRTITQKPSSWNSSTYALS